RTTSGPTQLPVALAPGDGPSQPSDHSPAFGTSLGERGSGRPPIPTSSDRSLIRAKRYGHLDLPRPATRRVRLLIDQLPIEHWPSAPALARIGRYGRQRGDL